ncbi:HAD family hydrolase [Streptomyces sp. NPDC058695]|uniref:HAD family hydrolase n=1 Tax=Streptomyces sp. NPDC058695 TaxID=3346604 RepID=UPI0036640BC1
MLELSFSAVCFDLDGTLVDTEPRSRAAWRKLFRVHGVGLDPAQLARFAGRPGVEAIADHLPSFPGKSAEALFREALGYARGADMPPVGPVAGALALLAHLRDRHVPMAVVTSGTKRYARAELSGMGALHLFDVVVTADDVEHGKPDPEGYLAAAAALGVAPLDTVAFEDAPAGVRAARAAGAYCVALTTTHARTDLGAADATVRDFSEIRWK